MIGSSTKQLLSTALSLLLVVSTTPCELGAQQTGYSGQGVPLSAEELQQLVAPIALYPDALVAQILAAATFPDQVTSAAGWLKQNSNLTGPTLMQAVDAQQWDPAVKGGEHNFPSVLDNMSNNLSWTSALGEAYSTQAPDVMSAVQVLRAKAQAAGNLKSSPQLTVVQQSPQVIVIQPTNPQVVYVPTYNPAVVYGYPYVTPGYSTAAVVTTGVLAFGAGIAIGAMMSGGCCGWGYSSWNCGWHGGTAVVYRGGAYYGNTAWQGSGMAPMAPRPFPLWCRLQRVHRDLRTWRHGLERLWQRERGPGIQSIHRNLCAWRFSLKRLRQRERRSSIQPKDRSLRRHCARVQCQWELGQLDGFEERPDCLRPASNDRSGIYGVDTNFERRQGCWRDRCLQQRSRGRNRKWQ